MQRWLGAVLTMLLIPFLIPTATHAQTERCFPETGICISGRIRDYWEKNGGLPVFGLPIAPQKSETIEGKSLEVQWFERNRIELHPENKAPYDVLIGRIGAERMVQLGKTAEAAAPSQDTKECRFFAETGHNVCGNMLKAWKAYGLELDGRKGHTEAENLALFGLPLTDKMPEKINGQEYTVQYFERARFELHPEVGKNVVLFGLLGAEVYAATAAPVAPTPAPEATPTPGPTQPTEPTQPPTQAPQLPAPSYNNCMDDPTAASAPNYPVQIFKVDKAAEIVTLQNVSGEPVDLTGWHMCSVRGSQEHTGISGVLAPYEAKEFPNITGDNMWSNENVDDGILYNANGQAVSYWHDPQQ